MEFAKLDIGNVQAKAITAKEASKAVASAGASETAYWRRFRAPVFLKEHAPITSIHYVPSSPLATTGNEAVAGERAVANPLFASVPGASSVPSASQAAQRYAVTAGPRVQLFSTRTDKVVKTVSRFTDVARSGHIRADGRLMVAGDDSGLIQVFDINSRAILRTFRGHKHPVHVTKFSSAPTQVLSGSDDQTVRLWDMPDERAVRVFDGHTDYVRAAAVSPDNASLLLSGSYDGTVRLWDARVQENGGEVMRMDHRAPVNDVVIYPTAGGGVALSAGGPVLRAWDLMMGGRCLKAVSNHQKAITSLALTMDSDVAGADAADDGAQAQSGLRILTGGLDQLVKVYDPAQDFRVTHTMRYPAPILCMALAPDESQLAVGMSDGTLCVRKRELKASEVVRRQERRVALLGGGLDHQLARSSAAVQDAPVQDRGGVTAQDDIRVDRARSAKLKPYDKFLKSFNYSAALDAVLRKKVAPEVTFALLLELIHRSPVSTLETGSCLALRTAVMGRDDVGLEPLLRFLLRHAVDPAYIDIVADTLDVVIDVYSGMLGQSPLVDETFGRIWNKIDSDLDSQQRILEVKGALEMILVGSTLSSALATGA